MPGMQKTTFFMSKSEAEALVKRLDAGEEPTLEGKAALISLGSPETKLEAIKEMFGPDYATSHLAKMMEMGYHPPAVESPKWLALVKQEFHDIDPSHCSDGWAKQWILFSDAQADEILDMLERTRDVVEVYAVHCEGGVSRSAAVAKFISVYFGLDFPESYMLYNKHVFSTLIRRWNQRSYGKEASWT